MPGTLHIMACCAYTYQPRKLAEEMASVRRHLEGKYAVGAVGYCPPTRFDEDEARRLIKLAYDSIEQQEIEGQPVLVSGLTNVGVLKIAYEEASLRHWPTIGVACKKALEHPLYPVTAQIIVGEQWGDESSVFVEMLDAIICIGNGKQSRTESALVKAQGKPAFEFDLPVLPPKQITV